MTEPAGPAFLRWEREHPRRRCDGCQGRGCYAERGRGGPRRRYDPADYHPDLGDRYEASCADCRGFGWVRISQAEAAYRASLETESARRAYRACRREVCDAYGIDRAHFDRLAEKRLGTDRSPAAWLVAAHTVADFFGGSV